MFGFMAEALTQEIDMDSEELEVGIPSYNTKASTSSFLTVPTLRQDVRWFTREEVASAKELVVVPIPGETAAVSEGAISIPGPYAIAHHL
jgi:NADH pyrophosphatase NudC (nudix superfamily)